MKIGHIARFIRKNEIYHISEKNGHFQFKKSIQSAAGNHFVREGRTGVAETIGNICDNYTYVWIFWQPNHNFQPDNVHLRSRCSSIQ